MEAQDVIVIGVFYELPCGKIAKTYRHKGCEVFYYFDDTRETSFFEDESIVATTWKIRRDLTDFPNARDPLLPYVFDLLWDIKRLSELRRVLAGPRQVDYDEILKMAKEHGYA